ISEFFLPGVDREKKPATTCKEGNVRRESGGDAPQGSADAYRVSQPRRRSHCQQNVRVRHDSLTVLRRTTEQAVVRSFTFRFSEVREMQKGRRLPEISFVLCGDGEIVLERNSDNHSIQQR